MNTKLYRRRSTYKNWRRWNHGYNRYATRVLALTLNEGKEFPYCLPSWQEIYHRNNKKHGDRRRMKIRLWRLENSLDRWREKRIAEVQAVIDDAKAAMEGRHEFCNE